MNPYTTRAIIKDSALFVGRGAELGTLYTLLAGMQSCSVVGPRRIGKSSLLYYLTQPKVYATYLPDATPYVLAFLDLQELAGLEQEDFFDTVAYRLGRASQGRLAVNPERDGTRRGFRRLLMRATDEGLRLVLCCDEFEMLSQNEHFGVNFFTYLRGLCSNYNLALVTSSRISLYDLCHQGNLETSQFWNIFTEQLLGLMPQKEAHTLIRGPFARAGIPLSAQEVAFVLHLAGPHPFFMQIACYHLFAARSGGHKINQNLLERSFLNEARPHYAYTWGQELNEVDQSALLALPHTPRATLRQAQGTAARDCPYTPLNPTHFRHLAAKALVIGSPESATLVSSGWRAFLANLSPPLPESKVAKTAANPLPITINRVPTPVQPVMATRASTGYVDFDLKVEPINATSCRVSVLNSPAGQTSATCRLPFNLNYLGKVMKALEERMISSVSSVSRAAPKQITPMTVGLALFRAFFSNTIDDLFFESLGEARTRGQRLRLKIHVDPEMAPQLAGLPWELLYNDRRRDFLSLNLQTPIIRYLDVQAPTRRPRISQTLRVLVAMASPLDLPPLGLVREQKSIMQAWGSQPHVTVDILDPATPSALHTRLRDWQPHVLHFMGHGAFDSRSGEGVLFLVTKSGTQEMLLGKQLGVLLANTPSLQLAVLNTCQSAQLSRQHDMDPFSGVAAALVMAGLPAVVAMQFPISDQAALVFANTFYARLSAGDPVDIAVACAREALYLKSSHKAEWATPVLFMRVDDGLLFDTSQ